MSRFLITNCRKDFCHESVSIIIFTTLFVGVSSHAISRMKNMTSYSHISENSMDC